MTLSRKIFAGSHEIKIITFIARMAWALFITQYQALGLFLEHLIEKKVTFKPQNIIFSLVNFCISFCFLYLALFKYYVPSGSIETLEFEKTLVRISYIVIICWFLPVMYQTYKKMYWLRLPKILKKQLQFFIGFLIIPHLFLEIITSDLFPWISALLPINQDTLLNLSTILESYAIYHCCKSIIRLRFLNFSNHVVERAPFNFINDFKDILEQLSHVTALKELAHITQNFFTAAFTIPAGRTRLYVRKTELDSKDDTHYDLALITTKVENFLANHDLMTSPAGALLRQSKIFIKDELEFTNFYEEQSALSKIIDFLDSINADVFLPIYERQAITAYIIVERHARAGKLYNNVERDEMLVFTSYLSNIINILKHSNLEALLHKEKELEEELYHKHQEINQYKESIKSFLRTNKDRKIGIVFYKNRRFTFANQAAQELIEIDVNTQEGHPIAQSFRQLARNVQQYKSSQTLFCRDLHNNKLILSGIPSLELNTVIIMVYYPEISDIIKTQFEFLKDPSAWDYLLYLETTQSGQLINQLIPGNGEMLLNFKINLLSTSLSRKATLLEMAEDDLLPTVEILHHISLRPTLHILKLTIPEKNDEVALKVFGINPLLDKNEPEALLQKLDTIGTLFIQNIHLLSLETQNYLAEFISYGYYHKLRSDHKFFSNVRIICSTTKNLQTLVTEGLFSKTLFNELKKTSLSMPSLTTLPDTEINQLTSGFTEQALKTQTFKNLLELSDKDKDKLLDQRPGSLQELKTKIHQVLVHKSTKHKIHDTTEFDRAYHVTDPELAQAIRMGKKALKDPQTMQMLWNKFKNQNKIATLLGVNRSSVNRRYQEYKFDE
ncbi:sigma 54-interacting transcriptional regulator [Candidatus Dependentiae bacterium]|nr:sigma 54-interacting transcriptional regulator [Candidatus Dependentiae bacterium]